MDIVQQEVSIFNDKLKQKAELVFDSCLDYSKDVELTDPCRQIRTVKLGRF